MPVLSSLSLWWHARMLKSHAANFENALMDDNCPALLGATRALMATPEGRAELGPDQVSAGLALMAQDENGARFLGFAGLFAKHPEKLLQADADDVETGLREAVAQGHTGEDLTTALVAFGATDRLYGAIVRGMREGMACLVNSDDLDSAEIACALHRLGYGPLALDRGIGPAIAEGMREGAGRLMREDNIGHLLTICDDLKDSSPLPRRQPVPYMQELLDGARVALDDTARHDPAAYQERLLKIGAYAAAISPFKERHAQTVSASLLSERQVQTAARALLKKQDEDRCTIGDLQAEAQEIPHLAFAIASMPEARRMVAFPDSETGTGYPMLIEATPRQGIRVSVGCRVNQTPGERIEAWLAHDNDCRRTVAIPAVFEGVAKLTQSPYRRHAATAAAELDRLAAAYRNGWAERLPEAAQARIEKVLPPRFTAMAVD